MFEKVPDVMQVHPCGLIITYPDPTYLPRRARTETSRANGSSDNSSRINRQKRQIANATAWLAKNSINKTTVFTLTTPVESDYRTQNGNVSKFFENFTKSHKWGKLHSYLWVREYQQNGRPHWHVLADTPFFPIEKIDEYWRNLWNYDGPGRPVQLSKGGNRFINSDHPRAAWYLTKYFVKSLKEPDTVRKFAISQRLAEKSKPILVNPETFKRWNQYDSFDCGHGVYYYTPKKWAEFSRKYPRFQKSFAEKTQ